MRILGLMSGTSHDGIDAAVVDFEPEGDGLTARVVHHDATPYDPELRSRLVAALPPAGTSLAEITRLDTLIGRAFADAALAAAEAAGGVDLIASHGQTVYHWVEPSPQGAAVRGTLQLGQPAWIAEATGIPVLSDVRIRDITAGGQGAPLVGLLDGLVLAGRSGRPAALNLGGIANLTVVHNGEVRAWDTGPANALIDAVVRDRGAHPAGYDADGALAAAGRIDETLLSELLAEPYYALRPPKSTGKELFHLEYVTEALRRAGTVPETADLVATLTELTVRTVADAARDAGVTELFVSGGGAHNPVIRSGIAAALDTVPVRSTEVLGLGIDEKEAVLMALIGWCTWHGVAASVPTATGACAPRVLGALTPGAAPLQLPEPRPMPAFLRPVG